MSLESGVTLFLGGQEEAAALLGLVEATKAKEQGQIPTAEWLESYELINAISMHR